MMCKRKCPFCLGGRDGATSKRVTKIGWRQTGRPRSLLITSTSTTTCLRIFRKVFTWFLNIWLSAFFCKPDSNLLSSIIWINPKRIHEQKPISIIVSFSVGTTHSTPIDCPHLNVFWCMGSPGFFSGLKARQGVPFSGLIWNYICVLPSPTQSTPDGSSASHPLSFDPINHTPGPRRLFLSTKSGWLVNFGLFPLVVSSGFLSSNLLRF